jgi:hypothetical protein
VAREEAVKRTITQIAVVPGDGQYNRVAYVALCDDGTVWEMPLDDGKWWPVPPIPQEVQP